MGLEKTLRQHLVEITGGTAKDPDFTEMCGQEDGNTYKEAPGKKYTRDKLNLLLKKLDGLETRLEVDDFELIGIKNIQFIHEIVEGYYIGRGFALVEESPTFGLVFEKPNERVYISISDGIGSILVTSYTETSRKVKGYEILKNYLVGSDDTTKSLAIMAYDLGADFRGQPRSYNLFSGIMYCTALANMKVKELGDLVFVKSEGAFPELKEFSRRAYGIAKMASENIMEGGFSPSSNSLKKIIGAYVLGVGWDPSLQIGKREPINNYSPAPN